MPSWHRGESFSHGDSACRPSSDGLRTWADCSQQSALYFYIKVVKIKKVFHIALVCYVLYIENL